MNWLKKTGLELIDSIFPLYGSCSLIIFSWFAAGASDQVAAVIISGLAFFLGGVIAIEERPGKCPQCGIFSTQKRETRKAE